MNDAPRSVRGSEDPAGAFISRVSRVRGALAVAQEKGDIGPGPLDEHLGHCAAFARVIAELGTAEAQPRCLDLGAGGGLPGLVLAVADDASWTLIDARARRCGALREAVVDLGLAERTAVVHGRAEALGWEEGLRGAFDVVTARAFASPAVTAECAVGFLRKGGVAVVSDPPEESGERWPADGVARAGLCVRDRCVVMDRRFTVLERVAAEVALPRDPGRWKADPLF